jgi:nucleoside-diphosphate-sugar epimerase
MTTVLVTGAAGYIGSVLCGQLLERGYSVIALDSMMYGQPSLLYLAHHPNFEFINGDVRDPSTVEQALKSADVIIPLAALVGAPACDQNPALARELNFESIAVLNKLRSPSQLVVTPTTNSGYGTRSGDVFCTEETPLEPISVYGRTKVEAESLLLDSENAISLRLATVFGASPRMRLDLMVNSFVWEATSNGYIIIFEKDFKRNFVHVRDVVDGFIFAVENSEKMVGKPFNLGLDAANISKEELALKIKEQIPGFYIHFSEFKEDPDKRNYVVSNERLRKAGFEATRSIEYGIGELKTAYKMLPKNAFSNA